MTHSNINCLHVNTAAQNNTGKPSDNMVRGLNRTRDVPEKTHDRILGCFLGLRYCLLASSLCKRACGYTSWRLINNVSRMLRALQPLYALMPLSPISLNKTS